MRHIYERFDVGAHSSLFQSFQPIANHNRNKNKQYLSVAERKRLKKQGVSVSQHLQQQRKKHDDEDMDEDMDGDEDVQVTTSQEQQQHKAMNKQAQKVPIIIHMYQRICPLTVYMCIHLCGICRPSSCTYLV